MTRRLAPTGAGRRWQGVLGLPSLRSGQPCTAGGPALTELELSRAAQKAVALAQQEKSAWTRADVIKYLGRVLPRAGRGRPGAAAAAG
jgi:hypothetical protein